MILLCNSNNTVLWASNSQDVIYYLRISNIIDDCNVLYTDKEVDIASVLRNELHITGARLPPSKLQTVKVSKPVVQYDTDKFNNISRLHALAFLLEDLYALYKCSLLRLPEYIEDHEIVDEILTNSGRYNDLFDTDTLKMMSTTHKRRKIYILATYLKFVDMCIKSPCHEYDTLQEKFTLEFRAASKV